MENKDKLGADPALVNGAPAGLRPPGFGQGEGGWIEWAGGECPVDPRETVGVRFRYNRIGEKERLASAVHWGRFDKPMLTDIIAYRPMSTKARLIAAAPALYEALAEVRGVLRDYITAAGEIDERDEMLLAKIDAALAQGQPE